MLVWLKNSEGKWERTGEPLEKFVQIAIDAKKRSNGIYPLQEAIGIVEKAISAPDNKHYRYELPAATAGAMRRVGMSGGEATPAKVKRDFVKVPGLGNIELVEAPKAKVRKETKPKKATAKPVVDEPARITSPEHTIELKAVPDTKVFTATVHGRKAVIVFQERNRSKADFRYNAITITETRLADASKVAKELNAPYYIGVQVRVGGKWDGGWLVPAPLYKQFRSGNDFILKPNARAAYAADKSSVLGVRFQEAK